MPTSIPYRSIAFLVGVTAGRRPCCHVWRLHRLLPVANCGLFAPVYITAFSLSRATALFSIFSHILYSFSPCRSLSSLSAGDRAIWYLSGGRQGDPSEGRVGVWRRGLRISRWRLMPMRCFYATAAYTWRHLLAAIRTTGGYVLTQRNFLVSRSSIEKDSYSTYLPLMWW